MKCDRPPYSLSDAGLLVFMFNNHGRKTSVVKCECGWYHIKEKDDDEARKNPVSNELFGKN